MHTPIAEHPDLKIFRKETLDKGLGAILEYLKGAEARLLRRAKVVILGAAQAGKTTLLYSMFPLQQIS